MSFEMQNLPGLVIFGCVLKPTVVNGQTENLIFYHSECSFGTKVLVIIKILSKKRWKQKLRTESGLVINTCLLPVKIKFGHVNIDGRLSNWTRDFLFKEVFKSLKKSNR